MLVLVVECTVGASIRDNIVAPAPNRAKARTKTSYHGIGDYSCRPVY